MDDLRKALQEFVDGEVCPVNSGCIAGFVAGAHNGWGWARNRVAAILKANPPDRQTREPFPGEVDAEMARQHKLANGGQ